jgi:hypothetical protein
MKLFTISETNRRGFLRQLGSGAVGIASGGWRGILDSFLGGSGSGDSAAKLASLYNGLDPIAAGFVHDFVFNLVNSWGDSHADRYISVVVRDGFLWKDRDLLHSGKDLVPVAPVEAVAGFFIKDALSADSFDAASILTGDDPTYVDKLFPGLIHKCVDLSVSRMGPKAFADGMLSWFDTNGYIDFNMLSLAFNNSSMQKAFQMTPAMLDSIRGTGVGIHRLIDKGLASEELVDDYLDGLRRMSSNSGSNDSVRDSAGSVSSSGSQEKLLDFDVPDDHYYASSMHQPFESRLRSVLAM